MTLEIAWSSELIPAIVQDADTTEVLMLAYVNQQAWEQTLSSGKVTFFSRRRQSLWTKGETSGHYLHFVSARTDCDGDTLLIFARPQGPVCHNGTRTCFGDSGGRPPLAFLGALSRLIGDRFASPPANSYVGKLVAQGLDRIIQKVGEEAVETVIAAKNDSVGQLDNEAADLLFHLMVLLQARGSSLTNVARCLESRHQAAG
jgi:phosphoribosyl-ATP pyrophosphohydrolase/phosphoribosyl-AMP cyclohydrolase